jgi:hypothetical protein
MNEQITTKRLDELERIAQAATPGPWVTQEYLPSPRGDVRLIMSDLSLGVAEYVRRNDAEYLIAVAPPTTLALIAALRAAWEREGRLQRHALSIIPPLLAMARDYSDQREYPYKGIPSEWAEHRATLAYAQAWLDEYDQDDTQHATGDENVSQDVQDA